jgi:hypothetical protein
MCSDGRIRNGKLSGRMANGPRINTGSYVIISLRDFEKDQKNCDIIGHASPSADIIKILKSSNNNKQKDDITFKESDDEFDDFNVGDGNNKDDDGNKDGESNKDGGNITFQDSEEEEEEDEQKKQEKDGGIFNDVWEDKEEENIKKNITKDELDDLIDLL